MSAARRVNTEPADSRRRVRATWPAFWAFSWLDICGVLAESLICWQDLPAAAVAKCSTDFRGNLTICHLVVVSSSTRRPRSFLVLMLTELALGFTGTEGSIASLPSDRGNDVIVVRLCGRLSTFRPSVSSATKSLGVYVLFDFDATGRIRLSNIKCDLLDFLACLCDEDHDGLLWSIHTPALIAIGCAFLHQDRNRSGTVSQCEENSPFPTQWHEEAVCSSVTDSSQSFPTTLTRRCCMWLTTSVHQSNH